MKRICQVPIAAGLFLCSMTQILRNNMDVPLVIVTGLLICGIGLEIWGLVLWGRSPEGQNSRFRQWKLGILGRGKKESSK